VGSHVGDGDRLIVQTLVEKGPNLDVGEQLRLEKHHFQFFERDSG
jgi:hypothetical protein